MNSMQRHARATALAREYLIEQHVECLQHAPTASGQWYCVLRTRHPDGSELTVKGRGVDDDAALAIAWHELRLECWRYYLDGPVISVTPADKNPEDDERFDVVYEPGLPGVRAVNELLAMRGIPWQTADVVFAAARPGLLRGASASAPALTVRQVADVLTRQHLPEQLRLGA